MPSGGIGSLRRLIERYDTWRYRRWLAMMERFRRQNPDVPELIAQWYEDHPELAGSEARTSWYRADSQRPGA